MVSKVDSLKSVIDKLQNDLQDAEKRADQFGTSGSDLQKQVDDLQSKVKKLTKSIENLEAQNKEYLDEIKRLIKDVEFCKSEANPDKVKELVRNIVIHSKYKDK